MSTVIWKITLDPDAWTYDLPLGAKVLSAGEQDHNLRVWIEVDPSARIVRRKLRAFPTGAEIPVQWTHAATAQFASGFVFHVYDGGEC